MFGRSRSSPSGSVTLTAAHDGLYEGTFDLTLHDRAGDHATGSFNTTACPALTNFVITAQHGCMN